MTTELVQLLFRTARAFLLQKPATVIFIAAPVRSVDEHLVKKDEACLLIHGQAGSHG